MNLTSQYKFVNMGKGKPTPAAAPASDVTPAADVIKRGKFSTFNENLAKFEKKKSDKNFQG